MLSTQPNETDGGTPELWSLSGGPPWTPRPTLGGGAGRIFIIIIIIITGKHDIEHWYGAEQINMIL